MSSVYQLSNKKGKIFTGFFSIQQEEILIEQNLQISSINLLSCSLKLTFNNIPDELKNDKNEEFIKSSVKYGRVLSWDGQKNKTVHKTKWIKILVFYVIFTNLMAWL